MKILIKNVTGISLLLIWLAPVLFSIFFFIKQSEIRFEMEMKLMSHELQQVIIPENEVIWMDDHEIRIDGLMFDIQSFILKNGVYTFTGLYDEEETALMNQQEENTDENQQKKQVLTELVKWFQSNYPLTDTENFIQPYCTKNFLSFSIATLSDLLKPVDIPPPRPILSYRF